MISGLWRGQDDDAEDSLASGEKLVIHQAEESSSATRVSSLAFGLCECQTNGSKLMKDLWRGQQQSWATNETNSRFGAFI